MLLANKKVAEYIARQTPRKTFIYRTHDSPDAQKLQNLQRISSQFGHRFNIKNPTNISKSLNKLLKSTVGKKEQNLIEALLEIENLDVVKDKIIRIRIEELDS